MTAKKRIELDFSDAGKQRTFDCTREAVDLLWDQQFDREVGDLDAAFASLNNDAVIRSFTLYCAAVEAVATFMADGTPTVEDRKGAIELLKGEAAPVRGRPSANRAERRPAFAFAAVYARMIRQVWREQGVALNGSVTQKADEWAARLALHETDLKIDESGACSDLAAGIPAALSHSSDRSYAATPIIELEPHRTFPIDKSRD
ncbi:hypothetical protein [Sphingomonas sp.]|uniref:hypothetical protein n=1 Tax=Sphingomonas sp. TaxID=28214 RepID=UPI0025F83C8E|nr:hypothetical protein [Sphingomonas sp.]